MIYIDNNNAITEVTNLEKGVVMDGDLLPMSKWVSAVAGATVDSAKAAEAALWLMLPAKLYAAKKPSEVNWTLRTSPALLPGEVSL